jgi:hypothetical protein
VTTKDTYRVACDDVQFGTSSPKFPGTEQYATQRVASTLLPTLGIKDVRFMRNVCESASDFTAAYR